MGIEFTLNAGGLVDYLKSPDAARIVAETAAERMDPFVPMKTGRLASSASAAVEGGDGVVRYPVGYAGQVYHGDGWRFSRERHPLASSHWDRAMIAAGGGAFIAELRRRLFDR